MSTTYTQEGRLLQATTPFGTDVLLPIRLGGSEAISRLFEISVDFLSTSDDLSAVEIVGQACAVKAVVADEALRHFHGIVRDFEAGTAVGQGLRQYRATLVPWLWLLTQQRRSRVFQNRSVKDILEEVLGECAESDFDLSGISGNHPSLEYCVQYEESDFDFLSRLMEDAGLFYFFVASEEGHKLTVADAKAAYLPAEQGEIEVIHGSVERGVVRRWERRINFGHGKSAFRDFDFRSPSKMVHGEVPTVAEVPSMSSHEFFEYRGRRLESRSDVDLAKVRMEEFETFHEVVSGDSTCQSFAPGHTFTIVRADAAEEENRGWLLTEVSHYVEDLSYLGGSSPGTPYSNRFSAIPEDRLYRPQRATARPSMSGPQTATVVGPEGDEIHTDEHGRIKVQFHWDRGGQNDAESSCFVRVAQPVAGAGWGAIFLPRIGQEVVVSFLQGDPDQPLVVGSVYNGDNPPPYELPANKTKSGFKSRSTTKAGPDNFNEISFEDKKGSELVYVHAEKNAERVVENDDSDSVGNNQTIAIGNDRTESVGNDESISVGNDRSESVGNDESVSVGNDRVHNVGKDDTLSVGETQTVSIGKDRTLDVTGSQSASVGEDSELQVGEKLSVDVGTKLAFVAGDEISLTAGKASIKLKKDGTIEIKGADIKVQGSGKVEVKASKDIVLKGQKIKQN